ncbi:MAG: hypothetical protein MJ252_06275 [archaeon]|nr:hypothetical protein [archaeon]
MQLITLRNNILDFIGGCNPVWQKNLNFAEMEGIQNLFKNFLFNTIVAIPPIIIGLSLSNVQDLMKYFSSILGFLLMVVVPIIVVTGYRFYFEKRALIEGTLNLSFLKGIISIVIIVFIGIVIFSFIIYGFALGKQSKRCIFEEDEDTKDYGLWGIL